ncbi:MAG: hypothetical protein R2706_10055 [Acidimicrobiales bacterium]
METTAISITHRSTESQPMLLPHSGSRTWHLRALLDRASETAGGVIIAVGTINNGLVLYLDSTGHLIYDHNAFGDHTLVRSPEPVPAGEIVIEVRQERVRQGPARALLAIDGRPVSEAIIPLVPNMISPIGLDIGRSVAGVSDGFTGPYDFEGRIIRLEIDTERAMKADDEAALAWAAALGTQ